MLEFTNNNNNIFPMIITTTTQSPIILSKLKKPKLCTTHVPMPMINDLPQDIIFNIFSRLPLKPLFQFRSIDHPYLARLHYYFSTHHPILITLSTPTTCTTKRTTFLHLAQLQVDADHERIPTLHATKLPFLELDFKFHPYHVSFGFCNGLIYFVDDQKPFCHSIIVSNPLRRECLRLPPIAYGSPPPTTTATYGLGFDSSTNSFKMVCVLLDKCTVVQTVGGTYSWRHISRLPPCPISGTPVFSRDFLYWKVDPCYSHKRYMKSLIVSFDVRNEEFSFIPHPEIPRYYQLLDLNGNLAIVKFESEGNFTLWVMKDYDQKNWVKECHIRIPNGERFTSLGKDGEILIKSSGGFFTYNSKMNELKYVHDFRGIQSTHVNSFTGSLFSFNHVMAEG